MLPKNHVIPLEAAHQILATFGITKPTKAYERWVKPVGFEVGDFDEVLFKSPFIFTIDCRAWLKEELETIVESLQNLEVKVSVDLDEEGEVGYVVSDGRRAQVKYRPVDDDSFDNVVQSLQRVVPEMIEFRRSPNNEGSHTYLYAVLPRDEWSDLERAAPEVIAHFFCPLPQAVPE
jgi:hypothetical protein